MSENKATLEAVMGYECGFEAGYEKGLKDMWFEFKHLCVNNKVDNDCSGWDKNDTCNFKKCVIVEKFLKVVKK